MIRVRHLALACSLVHICPREIKQKADFSVVDTEDYWIGSSKNSQDVVVSSLLRTRVVLFLCLKLRDSHTSMLFTRGLYFLLVKNKLKIYY